MTDLLLEQHAKDPVHALYSRKGPGGWTDVSVQHFLDQVTGPGQGPDCRRHSRPGETVAVMSATRYEWTVVDFAIWFAGGVTVPDLRDLLREPGRVDPPRLGGPARVRRGPGQGRPSSRASWTASTVLGDRLVAVVRMEHDGAAPNLASLAAAGTGVTDAELERHRSAASLADVASLVYTSGTTGKPKGCEITHANFALVAKNIVLFLPEILMQPRSRTLMFLPAGARPGPGGPGDLPERRDHPRPHRQRQGAPGGPGQLQAHLPAGGPPDLRKGLRRSRPQGGRSPARSASSQPQRPPRSTTPRPSTPPPGATAPGPGCCLRARHALFDRLLYPKLRQAFGGQLRYTVSGASPLSSNDAHFFRGAGIPVLEGYGLTETTAPCTANTPARTKVGTVGIPVPGTTIRVADDGEILVKGIGVFKGYHANEAANAEAFVDGFFRTGDLGSLDEDGFLTITGRKKDLLVTAGGKNVAPGPLEEKIREHQLVGQAVVIGDGRPFVSALVNLDPEGLRQLVRRPEGARHERRPKPPRDQMVRAAIQDAVDAGEPLGLQGRVHPQLRHPGRRLHRGIRAPDPVAQTQAGRRRAGLRGSRSTGSTADARRQQAAGPAPGAAVPPRRRCACPPWSPVPPARSDGVPGACRRLVVPVRVPCPRWPPDCRLPPAAGPLGGTASVSASVSRPWPSASAAPSCQGRGAGAWARSGRG